MMPKRIFHPAHTSMPKTSTKASVWIRSASKLVAERFRRLWRAGEGWQLTSQTDHHPREWPQYNNR